MTVRYGHCPCGEPLVQEMAAGLWTGMSRCEKIAPLEAGPGGVDLWVPYLAAWVCHRGWRLYEKAKDAGHSVPPTNPAAQQATRQFRVGLRGSVRGGR